MRKLRTIDLFCGSGAVMWGQQLAGMDPIYGVDRDHEALDTTRAAGFAAAYCDLQHGPSLLALLMPFRGSVDVLSASPPCQGWSGLGKKKRASDRREAAGICVTAAVTVGARWLVIENVMGLASSLYGQRLMEDARDKMGWATWWNLDAADYGVAQHRRRCFLVAGPHELVQPATCPMVNVRDVLPDIGAPAIRQEQVTAVSRSVSRPSPTVNTRGTIYTHPEVGVRRNKGDRVAGRRLTWQELALLQSFPPDYPFRGKTQGANHRLVGNAVPPILAAHVFRRIVRDHEEKSRDSS